MGTLTVQPPPRGGFSFIYNKANCGTIPVMSKQELVTNALEKAGTDKAGSTAAQIAILSERIANLQAHLETNKKDKHSRRGLLQMVADRRKLVKYMKRTDAAGWAELAPKLGLKN